MNKCYIFNYLLINLFESVISSQDVTLTSSLPPNNQLGPFMVDTLSLSKEASSIEMIPLITSFLIEGGVKKVHRPR